MIVEIVILAMIAAFLGLRLYSVLGRRPEQNDEPLRRRVEQPDASPAPRALAPRLPEKPGVAGRPVPALPEASGFESPAEAGIRAIVAADRRFDVGQFLTGARSAYGMVLEAFWRGEKDELSQLCDRDVYEGFASAIDARLAAGETLDARLIRIEDAKIVSAEYAAPVARVTVRFVADVASVTRDSAGTVIAGSLDDAIESRDLWTFSRDLTSRDPDWLLDETDEA
ncbi:Tim44/TimA family putative adaptor protein [Novosphingobium sp. KCTC 2891]|uniref:Tim44/TimA family putative adaptor protein n=1 Tax=Novosphingobium sp. KCTC 2891 TaxID=2989730 RepID=UPI002223D3E6|nr:Tim44/TimA family putative adaptor protein [Novosphingobium sp. KCTC 2891]MCW1383076.1 Tim44/TimA family putative adaptor protein [Novosphingobium sp. KCTC 2891]